MLEQFLGFAKLSARFLPFLLLCVALEKANLPKKKRYRQFPLIPIAVIYCIILVFYVDRLTGRLYDLVGVLEKYIPLLGRFDWTYWTVLMGNMSVLTLYIAMKGVLMPLLSGIFRLIEKYFPKKDLLFYEYDEKDNAYYLKENWGHFKNLYILFYYAIVIYSTVLLIMSYYFRHSMSAFSFRYYPVYGIIMFCEIASYMNGKTRSEQEKEEPEAEPEEHRNDYKGLKDEYLQLYAGRILTEDTARRPEEREETPQQVIEQLQTSSLNVEKAFGDYLKREMELGNTLSIDYILSSRDMLRGKSVLFANPFYKDLTSAVFFPFNIAMLRHNNGLILIGRDGTEDEIRKWALEGFEAISHVPQFWRIGIISETSTADYDIGILSLKDMNNVRVLARHKAFFAEVGFVLILEPSRIVTMNQLALSILSYMIGRDGRNVIYCSCDRNTDGAVDALSHILRTSITQVGATVPSSKQSTMLAWNIDGEYLQHKLYHNIIRYLGGGVSIASVALKHGIDKVSWFADRNMPMEDMRWIAGQYFEPITEYIGRTASQDSVYRSIDFESNLWGTSILQDCCLIVEDEYNNLFEMGRQFATRAKEQTFLHILSPEYMLRDYMCDNPAIFKADPKAIPQIVADFARTRRNSVMQLVMQLISGPVSDDQISELLAGVQIRDEVTRDFLDQLIGEFYEISGFGNLVKELKSEAEYDEATRGIVSRKYYTITNDRFIKSYASDLRTAYYLAEDDETMEHFLGGRLKGQVYQTFLPGQFVTLAGKYYEVLGIQSRSEEYPDMVVVRRAADHMTGRRYYRQLRSFRLDQPMWEAKDYTRRERAMGGIQASLGFANMTVHTNGYLQLDEYNNLAGASRTEVGGIPDRIYLKKYILRIVLSDASDLVRTQIALMLNEVFRSVFPECYEYISAVTDISWNSSLKETGLPELSGEYEKNAIYILEDSQIDLGLTIAVERYLDKLLQILCDYCEWSLEKIKEMEETENAPQGESDGDGSSDESDTQKENPVRKGLFGRIWEKIKAFFGKFRKKSSSEPKPSEETEGSDTAAGQAPEDAAGAGSSDIAEDAGGSSAEADGNPADSDERVETGEMDKNAAGTDEPEDGLASVQSDETGSTYDGEEETETKTQSGEGAPEGTGEKTDGEAGAGETDNDSPNDGKGDSEKKPAGNLQRLYLYYGNNAFPDYINIEEVYRYLYALGYGSNYFTRVRKGTDIIHEIEETYHPEDPGRTICDFCGSDITGMEHDVLKDGRCRCIRCGASVVKAIDEFSEIYKDVRSTMEERFGISLQIPVKVKMVSASTLSRISKIRFRPTSGFDARCTGLAVSSRGGYTLYVENGAPEENTRETIAHELTHIWQYRNWDQKEIISKYGKQSRTEVYEGMAVWVSIRYMMLTGNVAYAKRLEIGSERRNDEYGRGYLKYRDKYGSACNLKKTVKAPFKEPKKPL